MTRSEVDCVRLLIWGPALMPTLPLHRLSASTVPTAIALIEAVMLAPNDPEGRDELYRYSERAMSLRAIDRIAAASGNFMSCPHNLLNADEAISEPAIDETAI